MFVVKTVRERGKKSQSLFFLLILFESVYIFLYGFCREKLKVYILRRIITDPLTDSS